MMKGFCRLGSPVQPRQHLCTARHSHAAHLRGRQPVASIRHAGLFKWRMDHLLRARGSWGNAGACENILHSNQAPGMLSSLRGREHATRFNTTSTCTQRTCTLGTYTAEARRGLLGSVSLPMLQLSSSSRSLDLSPALQLLQASVRQFLQQRRLREVIHVGSLQHHALEDVADLADDWHELAALVTCFPAVMESLKRDK